MMEIRQKPPEEPDEGGVIRKLALFSVILGDLAGYTGAGIGIGYFLWKKWGAPWWVFLLTSIAGLSLAFFRVYQISAKENDK